MSIAPVQGFPLIRTQSENTSVGTGQAQVQPVSARQPASPVSGTPPKQENFPAKSSALNYELPQDVIEVHQDPANKSQVIIQYLDKAGNMVLQIPSNQELSVERGIARDMQQAAKLRQETATTAARNAGGKTRGN